VAYRMLSVITSELEWPWRSLWLYEIFKNNDIHRQPQFLHCSDRIL